MNGRLPLHAVLVLALVLAWAQPGSLTRSEEPPRQAHTAPRLERESGAEEPVLRNATRLAAFIQRLDAARKAGDVLPVHALDLSLRKAVEQELEEGRAEMTRGRALRLQNASHIGPEEGLQRDQAYSTPVESRVDPSLLPEAPPRKYPLRKRRPEAEEDLDRRRRDVVRELEQLDSVLDEAGLNARRDLLIQLLEITRARDAQRKQTEAPED